MAANHNREPDGSALRLDRFRSFTVAHPRLVEAKETLINAIRGPSRIRSFLCLDRPESVRQRCG